MSLYQQFIAIFFVSIVLLSTISPALARRYPYDDRVRAIKNRPNTLSNKIPSPIYEENLIDSKKPEKESSTWDMFDTAMEVLSGKTPAGPENGEFSWTKIITLGLQLVLSFFGVDNQVMEKMDPGSPIEAFLTGIIAYFTGSTDAGEVTTMAKQATQLWDILISLLETLRTSFSQRSLGARSLGSNDLLADAGVATSAMFKGYLKTYSNPKESCMQKYVCQANKECAEGTSEAGYYFCQMSTFAMGYLLEDQTDLIGEAGRKGRLGENCDIVFTEC